MSNLRIFFLVIIFTVLLNSNSFKLEQNLSNKIEDIIMNENIITTLKGIEESEEKIIYLEGIYLQKDVRYNREDPKTLYEGHIVILLEDENIVFFYPPFHKIAVRSSKEIKKFENKKVLLKCRALPFMPLTLEEIKDMIAHIEAPCITELISIELK